MPQMKIDENVLHSRLKKPAGELLFKLSEHIPILLVVRCNRFLRYFEKGGYSVLKFG